MNRISEAIERERERYLAVDRSDLTFTRMLDRRDGSAWPVVDTGFRMSRARAWMQTSMISLVYRPQAAAKNERGGPISSRLSPPVCTLGLGAVSSEMNAKGSQC